MFWNRRSRSCIERTGDGVYGERRRGGGVVAGTGGVATDVGSGAVDAGDVEAEDCRVFDGRDGDVGEGRDATAAYEGRIGETG